MKYLGESSTTGANGPKSPHRGDCIRWIAKGSQGVRSAAALPCEAILNLLVSVGMSSENDGPIDEHEPDAAD